MALGWGTRRQFLYTGVAGVVFLLALFVVYESLFSAAPTCFDTKQDGDELGVDCGGSCSLLCQNDVKEPAVLWSRSFLVASSTYTAAAYVKNNNTGAGAHQAHYTFELRDKNNLIIAERDGVVDLPPVQIIPIVETGIDVGYAQVATTLFYFSDKPQDQLVWNTVPAQRLPALSIGNESLSPGGTRLSATISNDSLDAIASLTVVAVLFDDKGTAVAASKSVLNNLAAKSSQDAVFTWPLANPAVFNAEVTVLPSF